MSMPSRYVLKVADEVPGKVNSLSKLRDYLKRRKEEYGEDHHLPAFQPGPNTLNHTIRILAKGGKKSRTIPVSMPGLIPIPLYYTVSIAIPRIIVLLHACFSLSLQSFSGLGYGRKLVGVCEVADVEGVRVVTIRSSVQVCT